jgi:curved DNA-binding protein CbpA
VSRAGPYPGTASHYDTLGLTPAATHEEIRQAYIERALRHHPDRQDGQDAAARADAERQMQEVNGAWAVLADRDARAAYDAELGIDRDEAGPIVDDLEPGRPVGLRANVRPFVALILALGLLLVFFVFTAYAGAGRN